MFGDYFSIDILMTLDINNLTEFKIKTFVIIKPITYNFIMV